MIELREESLNKYTTFRTGGKAERLLLPENIEEVKEAVSSCRASGEDYIVIGNGSNLLVSDKGYKGTVICISDKFGAIKVDGDAIYAEAGAMLSAVARTARDNGLAGFEFASGIPGSLGGAVFMNAGAYGGEIKDVIKGVTAVSRETGEIKEMTKDELDLSYRHSIFTETGDIITEAVFEMEPADREAIEEKMKDLAEKRNSKQPLQYPSAGSFFKRPEGFFAGKLIQDAGLKGLSVGGAQVSEKHSGFIINTGNATATDIISLMHLVQNTVYDKFGVMLEPEVRIVGEDAAE